MGRLLYFLSKVVERCLSLAYTIFLRMLPSNVNIGKGSIVYYRSSIVCLSRLGGAKIGKNCKIGCSPKRYHAGMPFYTRLLVDGQNSIITIGDNCRINGASIHASSSIEIGNNCVIASGVSIIDSNGHEVYSKDRTVGRDNPQPVNIGNNVWVGLNAVILKGSSIGDNCVVSVGSVVKGSFPRNSLIAGNPAVIVKHLEIEK